MFDLCGDDVFGCARSVANDAENSVIIGFSAAAGEDDFLGTSAEERGDLFASSFDGGACALAWSVDGSGVAEIGGEIGQHRVEDGGFDRGGGVVIEVDARHGGID